MLLTGQAEGMKRMVTPYEQARDYVSQLSLSEKPRYFITCNFQKIRIYDCNIQPSYNRKTDTWYVTFEEIELKDLVTESDTRSIREIIANACLHRSYMDSSAIQVSIYDDRVEVDSPGMLYDGLNVAEALSGKSKCRNKAIAEAFQYMKIIEGWGTGLPRLFSQCKGRGLPVPKFEEFGDGIKVTVYRKMGDERVNGTTPTTQSTTQSTQLPDERKLSDTEISIVNAMKENGKITQSQLAANLGIDVNTVKYYVRNLSRDKVIERNGNNRSGEWVVLVQ